MTKGGKINVTQLNGKIRHKTLRVKTGHGDKTEGTEKDQNRELTTSQGKLSKGLRLYIEQSQLFIFHFNFSPSFYSIIRLKILPEHPADLIHSPAVIIQNTGNLNGRF